MLAVLGLQSSNCATFQPGEKKMFNYKNSFLVEMHEKKYGNNARMKTQENYFTAKRWRTRKTRLPLICCNTDIILHFVYIRDVDNVNP